MITIYYINIKILFILYGSVIILDYIEINVLQNGVWAYQKHRQDNIVYIDHSEV